MKVGLYEGFHSRRKLQRTIINKNNFTYRHVLEVLNPYLKGRGKILDVGCGVGTLDFYLANKNKNVVGIDISGNAIKIAVKNAKVFGLDRKTRFFQMEFPDERPKGKFDLIIVSEVLEHLREDDLAVKAISKLLVKDGKIIVAVPSLTAPLHRMGLLKKFDQRVGHLRRYSRRSAIQLFRDNGFETLEVKEKEGIIRGLLFTNSLAGILLKIIRGPISDLVTLMDNVTIPIFGASQIYIVAKIR